jgi:hypothetical protein
MDSTYVLRLGSGTRTFTQTYMKRTWNLRVLMGALRYVISFLAQVGTQFMSPPQQLLTDSDMDFDVPDFAPSTSADTTNIGMSLFLPGPVSPVNRMVPLSPLRIPQIMSSDGPASSAPSSPDTAASTIVRPPVTLQSP